RAVTPGWAARKTWISGPVNRGQAPVNPPRILSKIRAFRLSWKTARAVAEKAAANGRRSRPAAPGPFQYAHVPRWRLCRQSDPAPLRQAHCYVPREPRWFPAVHASFPGARAHAAIRLFPTKVGIG